MSRPHTPGETIPLKNFFGAFVPAYRGASWRPFVVRIRPWTDEYSPRIGALNPDRAAKRIASYIDPAEIARARRKLETKGSASIRFGVSKVGRGYTEERGDFCLVGGAVRDQHLSLFYRSLELIGGFGYDVVLIDHLGALLDRKWRSVTIHAAQASVFAPQCNHSQTKPNLFKTLTEVFQC